MNREDLLKKLRLFIP